MKKRRDAHVGVDVRWFLVIAVALASCAPAAQSVAPAPVALPPTVQPSQAPEPPEPPEPPAAKGERLFIDQASCVYPCPTYRLEVYANGRVRWEGMHFVSAIGERVFAIDPEQARMLFEQWSELNLDVVPKTYRDATRHDHVTPRRTTHVSADGVGTQRYEAAFPWRIDEPIDPHGFTRSGIEAMASVLANIDEAVGLAELITPKKCWAFYSGSAGTDSLGRSSAAETAARWYFKHPDFFVVRIVAFDRPRALQEAMKLRKALFALGVPAKSVWLRRLPAVPGSERMGWGWVAAATPRCFSAAT